MAERSASHGNDNCKLALVDDLVDYTEPEVSSPGAHEPMETVDATVGVSHCVPVVSVVVATTRPANEPVRAFQAVVSSGRGESVSSGPGENGSPSVAATDARQVVERIRARGSNQRHGSPNWSSDSRRNRGSGGRETHRGTNSAGSTGGYRAPSIANSSPGARDAVIPAEQSLSASQPQEMSGGAPATGTGDEDTARAEQVRIGARYYPGPAAYDEVDVFATDETTIHVLTRAPWFDKEAIFFARDRIADAENGAGDVVPADVDEFHRYLNARGCLPGDLPRSALDTWIWRQMFSVRDSDLRQDDLSLVASRQAFVGACMRGLRRLLTRDEMEEEVSDLFVYRTRGEMSYVEALNELSEEQLAAWSDGEYGSDDALLFTRPLLSRKFRYETKKCSFVMEQIAEEKSLSIYYNLLVPF